MGRWGIPGGAGGSSRCPSQVVRGQDLPASGGGAAAPAQSPRSLPDPRQRERPGGVLPLGQVSALGTGGERSLQPPPWGQRQQATLVCAGGGLSTLSWPPRRGCVTASPTHPAPPRTAPSPPSSPPQLRLHPRCFLLPAPLPGFGVPRRNSPKHNPVGDGGAGAELHAQPGGAKPVASPGMRAMKG